MTDDLLPPNYFEILLSLNLKYLMIMLRSVSSKWKVRRGLKTNIQEKDMLSVCFCVLNHGQQWGFTGKMIKISCCTIERQIKNVL